MDLNPLLSLKLQEVRWNVSGSWKSIKGFVNTLPEKCPLSEFFWSVFSHIRTEYRDILRISQYAVQMRENTDQKNSKYGHFPRSDRFSVQGYYFILAWIAVFLIVFQNIFFHKMWNLFFEWKLSGKNIWWVKKIG